TGYIYEPTKEQIRNMLQNLRNNKPVPTNAIQFSGGEPTVREDLPELIKLAKSLGFDHVEVNTNGIAIFNKGPLYIEKLVEAGMDTLYLQFDGFGEEIYKKTRGVDLTEKKLKIIEYCRKVGFKSVVLVVTLVNDVNTHQVGKIIRYAAENNDVVRCVNFQPVSITGRMDRRKLKRARVTNSDLIELIEKQTDGEIKAGDFYPVPFVVSFARAMGAIKGKNYPEFTCHPYCGTATFIFVEDGKIVPISKYVNLEKFEESLRGVEKTAKEHKTIAKFKLLWSSIRNVHPKILSYLFPVLKEGSYEGLGKFMRKLIMIGSMHFMDPYNFDFERVQRCVIHYAIPDGRIIPFCTMNTFHRVSVEKKFSKPLR
ncbi:MAG: radical SAM protein, partial [Candidatus Aenigmarchaeota archaeon]|nr:radical SAM protein [Candidatus Aenigmarchaeota archaeon]